MKRFLQEIAINLKDLGLFIINAFFMLWAHIPVLSLTSDNNFTNISFPRDKKDDFRISLFTIYFGEYVFHFFSLHIFPCQFSLCKKLILSELPCFNTDEESEEFIKCRDNYKKHFSSLNQKEKNIELEVLKNKIDEEEARISKSDTKISLYSTIFLAVISLFSYSSIRNHSWGSFTPDTILLCLTIYFLINLFALVLQNLKVKSFYTPSFSELKKAENKQNYYARQLYIDWYFKKEKASMYVSYIHRINDYIQVLLCIILLYGIFTFTKNINTFPKPESEEMIFTINTEKCFENYTDDNIKFTKILINLKENKFSRCIILYNSNIPDKLSNILDFYYKQKIIFIIDTELQKGDIKIILEN